MAGTISLSLSQQFNSQGAPLAGGRLYFFQAGTTTPQSAYQDSGLTIPHANPIILDAAGRIPQFFLADGSIKIRLDSETGVTQLAADGILVIGAASGGGGGSPVDATTVLQTGDIKVRYGTGVHTGWVRANGRTIGSATSGATERANADAEALFLLPVGCGCKPECLRWSRRECGGGLGGEQDDCVAGLARSRLGWSGRHGEQRSGTAWLHALWCYGDDTRSRRRRGKQNDCASKPAKRQLSRKHYRGVSSVPFTAGQTTLAFLLQVTGAQPVIVSPRHRLSQRDDNRID